MNHVYRVIWDHTQNRSLVVSELAKGKTKSSKTKKTIAAGVISILTLGISSYSLAAPIVGADGASWVGASDVGKPATNGWGLSVRGGDGQTFEFGPGSMSNFDGVKAGNGGSGTGGSGTGGSHNFAAKVGKGGKGIGGMGVGGHGGSLIFYTNTFDNRNQLASGTGGDGIGGVGAGGEANRATQYDNSTRHGGDGIGALARGGDAGVIQMYGGILNNHTGAVITTGTGGNGQAGNGYGAGAIGGQANSIDPERNGHASTGDATGGEGVGGDGGHIYLAVGEINNSGAIKTGNGGIGIGGIAGGGTAYGYNGSAHGGNAYGGSRFGGNGGSITVLGNILNNTAGASIIAGDGGNSRMATPGAGVVVSGGNAYAYYFEAIGGDAYGGSGFGGDGGVININTTLAINNNGRIVSGTGGSSFSGGIFDSGASWDLQGRDFEALSGTIYAGTNTSGNGGNLSLVTTKLTNQNGASITAGSGGRADGAYARGMHNYSSTSTAANALNKGGWAYGGDALAGKGGNITLIASTVANLGNIVAGNGGYSQAGAANGGAAQVNHGNMVSGTAGSGYGGKAVGGQGGSTVFSGATLVNSSTGNLYAGHGGSATGGAAQGGHIGYGDSGAPSAIRGNAFGGHAVAGDGGIALSVISSNSQINNAGKVVGGSGGNASGGNAGASYDGNATGGNATGGNGGMALVMLAGGTHLTNTGDLLGGNGGKATAGVGTVGNATTGQSFTGTATHGIGGVGLNIGAVVDKEFKYHTKTSMF